MKHPNKTNSRRKFLKIAAAGVVLTGAGYSLVKLTASFEDAIIIVLRNDLSGLNIKDTTISAFAKMAAQQNPWQYGSREQRLISMYGGIPISYLPLPYKKQFLTYKHEITTRFLLSSDFFINKMDETKEITFSGKLWAPYTMPCMNPFSNLFYPEV